MGKGGGVVTLESDLGISSSLTFPPGTGMELMELQAVLLPLEPIAVLCGQAEHSVMLSDTKSLPRSFPELPSNPALRFRYLFGWWFWGFILFSSVFLTF